MLSLKSISRGVKASSRILGKYINKLPYYYLKITYVHILLLSPPHAHFTATVGHRTFYQGGSHSGSHAGGNAGTNNNNSRLIVSAALLAATAGVSLSLLYYTTVLQLINYLYLLYSLIYLSIYLSILRSSYQVDLPRMRERQCKSNSIKSPED
jgi:hypothetical protein